MHLGKYTIILLGTFALAVSVFADADFKFGNGEKRWSYSGAAKIELADGFSKFSAASDRPFMFKRIEINPDKTYEITAEGSGECSLSFTPDYSPMFTGLKFRPQYAHIFKNGTFKKTVRFPRSCPDRVRIDFRAAKNGGSFTVSSLSIREVRAADAFRFDRKKLKSDRPSPAVVRGVANVGYAREIASSGSNVCVVKFSAASDADAVAAKAAELAKSGVKALLVYAPKDGKFDISAVGAVRAKVPAQNVWAWSLSEAETTRAKFAEMLAQFRKIEPDAWAVFNVSAKSLDKCEPLPEYRVVYSPSVRERSDLDGVVVFKNFHPAPILARGVHGFARDFEKYSLSWIVDSLPAGAAGDSVKRLLCKSGSKQFQLDALKRAYLASPHEGCLNFAFASDTHYFSNPKNPKAAGASSAEHMRDMAKVARELKLDFVCNGGDLVQGAKPKARSIADMREMTQAMETSGLPVVITIGNHDDGVFYFLRTKTPDDSQVVTGEEWHDACVATALKSGAVGDENFPKANYFYLDFPKQKIRVINIATSENPMEVGADGRVKIDSCGLYDITQRQLNWLAHKALDFSQKPDASEWGVVFVMHTQIVSPNLRLFDGVLDAFRTGGKFSGQTATGNFPSRISCDFTGRGKMQILLFVEGHEHADEVFETRHGCSRFRVLNDKNRPEFPDSPPRNYGEADDASWSVVSIDRRANEFRVLRFGAGTDFSGKLLLKK